MDIPKPAEAWGCVGPAEPRWHAAIAIVGAAGLNVLLPGKFTLGPPWLIPLIEMAILIPLLIVSPRRSPHEGKGVQIAAVTMIAIANAANVASLFFLIRELLFDSKNITGLALLYSSVAIWLTNIIVFALWYWELDRGGPHERMCEDHREPDFLFPQMVTPGCSVPDWTPSFIDYFYTSFTNATAFSPTDTMPLTPWAKSLFLIEAAASLATIAIVASRAINILS